MHLNYTRSSNSKSKDQSSFSKLANFFYNFIVNLNVLYASGNIFTTTKSLRFSVDEKASLELQFIKKLNRSLTQIFRHIFYG